MTPLEFLSAVWPSEGVYALATPFTIPGTQTRVYAHKTFTSLAAAAEYARVQSQRNDIFFAVHTLKEPRVWNPNKVDRKTGEKGAFEVRTHQNMSACRCFFFDIDVDASDDNDKYETQGHALAALKSFCASAGLPRPMVTSSGGGLHVYWLLEEAMSSPEWAAQADTLKQLAVSHGLKIDTSRTTDVSSVLRVAGTFNRKDPLAPRPVRALTTMVPLPNTSFLNLLAAARIEAGVAAPAPKAPGNLDDLFTSNLSEEFSGPPVAIRAVAAVCGQMRRLIKLQGNVSEPEWYHSLNLVRFMENSDKLVHKISQGHPQYSAAATDAKVAQLREKNLGPTTCAKLMEVCGSAACKGCPVFGKVKSPIVAGRYKDPAPAPVVASTVGPTAPTVTIPDPPKPYTRLKSGALSKTTKNKDGDEINVVFYAHDLYPLKRVVNDAAEQEKQVWRVHLPRSGAKDFMLDSDALYDKRKFVTAIANHGIYPSAGSVQDLQDYMIAYISELQRLVDAEVQSNHLGWEDDYKQFILPDKVICSDGTAKPAVLSVGAQRASAHVHTRGTLDRQIELLRFYSAGGYITNQFYILASLAAPIFHMTGHAGIIVHATGEAGASKSTSLYTAASMWGHPSLMPMNGTNNGATIRGRNERITTLANLPICVDEITHMATKDAIDLAMSVTQPGHRIRLDERGIERAGGGDYKATIMLTNANSSLHNTLSTDNSASTAGSMRVFEIIFRSGIIHEKHEADAYMADLRDNYGHVGEVFITYVIADYHKVKQRVSEMMKRVDQMAGIQSSERFWSAAVAAVVVAGEIAKELGLLDYDTAALFDWAVNVQIPFMRGVVVDEYTDPMGILSNYLETINADILVMHKPATGANLSYVSKAPRGALLGHYDVDDKVLWVLRKGFKDYCVRNGANSTKIIDELSVPKQDRNGKVQRVVVHKNMKKVLGAGSEYAKAQSWCFAVNMGHPEVTGVVDLAVAATTDVPVTTPAKGKLKPV